MVEWINTEDRLPEENCPVLIRVGKDIHVAYLRRAKQEEHSSAYVWLPFDNSMGWFPFEVSSWAEIPKTDERKTSESNEFGYIEAAKWFMLIMLLATIGNRDSKLNSGWFYKDSGKEYKGAIYTGKDMFADKDGNEIIYIPPSKR